MNNGPVEELLELVYQAVNVPIHLVSVLGEVLFCAPRIAREADPVVMDPVMLTEFRDKLFAAGEPGPAPILKVSRYSLFYAALPCPSGECFLVLGPAPSIGVIAIDLEGMVNEHAIRNFEEFKLLITCRINPLSADQFLSVCRLVYFLEWGDFTDENQMRDSANVMPIDKYNLDHFLFFFIFQKRESDPVRVGLGKEPQLLRFILEGDARAALRYFKDAIERIENAPGEQALVQAQNAFIGLCTLIVHSVIQAGFNEEEAWFSWNYYTLQARQVRSASMSRLNKLYAVMIQDFCERVAHLKGRYSRQVLNSMRFISDHLHEEIPLEALARQAAMSANYFSELFKNETGMSVPRYIQSERIKEAKSLLTFTDQGLVDISNYLNFSSQSYFSKVFKQHTGMTPQKYRSHYQAGREQE